MTSTPHVGGPKVFPVCSTLPANPCGFVPGSKIFTFQPSNFALLRARRLSLFAPHAPDDPLSLPPGLNVVGMRTPGRIPYRLAEPPPACNPTCGGTSPDMRRLLPAHIEKSTGQRNRCSVLFSLHFQLSLFRYFHQLNLEVQLLAGQLVVGIEGDGRLVLRCDYCRERLSECILQEHLVAILECTNVIDSSLNGSGCKIGNAAYKSVSACAISEVVLNVAGSKKLLCLFGITVCECADKCQCLFFVMMVSSLKICNLRF